MEVTSQTCRHVSSTVALISAGVLSRLNRVRLLRTCLVLRETATVFCCGCHPASPRQGAGVPVGPCPRHALLGHPCVFSGELSVQMFCPFFNWVLFLLLNFESSLCILDATPLSGLHLLKIFSRSAAHLFML